MNHTNLTKPEETIIDMVDRIFGGSVDLEELENNDQQFQQQLDNEEEEQKCQN